MNFDVRPILLVIGLLLTTLGCAMILPAIVDLMAENDDWEVFAFSGLLTLITGVGFMQAPAARLLAFQPDKPLS